MIALDRTTVAALRAHRARQLAERAAAGQDYLDSGYVFTRLNGDPMAPDWLSRYFRQLNDASALPPIRLHDLRHGASLALAVGVDLKVVQDMLGHSSIVLTADTYTSVLPDVARRVAEDIASLIIIIIIIIAAGRLGPRHSGTPPPGLAQATAPRPHHGHSRAQPRPPRPPDRDSAPAAVCTPCGQEDAGDPAQRSGNTPGEAGGHTMANSAHTAGVAQA